GIDLSRTAIELSALDPVPRNVAESDLLLALSNEGGRLHMAVNGTEFSQETLDEVQFITGFLVSPYAALPGQLETAIAAAYDARERGEPTYRGEGLLPDAEGGLAIVTPPEPITAEEIPAAEVI